MSKVILPKRRIPRHKRKERGPIPYVISLELAFLPEDLDELQYEGEVRKVIRTRMQEILAERAAKLAWTPLGGKEAFLFEEYDDFVSDLIEEEIARN